jgi:hypothetical protein
MSQFAIFFLDWRLKTASGDFFGTYISVDWLETCNKIVIVVTN